MTDNTLSAREILKQPYARVLIPNDNGVYSAELLEFPGCYACGNTAEEAIANLEKAAESWIDAARGQEQEIPEPLASYGYSGKINLRLPKSIHKAAARFAQRDDVSLNQFFSSAIAARVGAEDFCDRLIQKLESRLMPFTPIAMFQHNVSCVLLTADLIGSFVSSTALTASSPWTIQPIRPQALDFVSIPSQRSE